jgi:hypothetical protein
MDVSLNTPEQYDEIEEVEEVIVLDGDEPEASSFKIEEDSDVPPLKPTSQEDQGNLTPKEPEEAPWI